MRILISGYHNPHFETITEYVEEAIGECGHEALIFDNRAFVLPGRVRERAPALQRADLARLNRRLLRLADRRRPTLFLESGGHRILPETVDRLRELGIRTVLWTIDAPIDFEPVVRAAPRYDHVFCGGTEALTLLPGATWLPFACSARRHTPLEPDAGDRRRYATDVAFVGSRYDNREDLLATFVRDATDRVDLGIWGPGWSSLDNDHPLRLRVRGDRVAPGEWLAIFAAAKIVLVAHYQDGATPCFQASPRVYEALASRSFVLVDDQRDVFELFEDGTHLVRYRDADELRRLALHYLDRREERDRIAQRGREEVLARHTYRHRIEELLRRTGLGVR